MKKQHKQLLLLIALVCQIINACTKSDDYRKYITGGEIIYTAAVDSAKVFGGHNRAKITWIITTDPRIVKARVYWNFQQKFVEIPVHRTEGIDTISFIIDSLEESQGTEFQVFTYDSAGHRSIPVYAIGKIYGSMYASTLYNQPIRFAFAAPSGPDTFNGMFLWSGIDASAGIVGARVKYTMDNNSQRDTIVPVDDAHQQIILPNYKKGTAFQYSTLFKPDSLAIDTFAVPYNDVVVP